MRISASELIGRNLCVKHSPNTAEQGLQGEIIDETQHTLLVNVDGVQKRIIKAQRTFVIDEQIVKGDAIHHKPEDRIKRAS